MVSEDLDNELSRIDKEVTKGITTRRRRVPKINRKNLQRYKNPLIDRLYDRYAQLAPVIDDEFYPNRMRKARTPYWLEYAAYGVQKVQDNQLLRELGNTWVVQRCKSIIIDEVLSNDYNFVPKKGDDYSNETSNVIDIAKTLFENMNRRGENFKDIMRGYLNDTLDLGLGIGVKGFHKQAYFPINTDNLYPEETEKPNIEDLTYVPKNVGYGMLREFTAYDASSFYAQPDHHGSTIGWWQWLNQGTPIFFGEREIVPMILYPVTYSPYGISPVEVVKNLVSVLVNSVSNMEQFMEDGAVPPAICVLSKINKSDYEDFIDRWEADVEGNNTEIPIISVGEDGEFKFQPLTLNSADIKQLDTLDVYQKIVMSVFHVTPDELGFTDTSNRSVGEAQAKVQQRVSIFPFMDRIETIVNRFILPELDPEGRIKFEFKRPQTEQDKQTEWNLIERKLNAGVMTINEYLNTIGKPTVPWGNIPFNMGLWTSLAERFDISLFGFREQAESVADSKISFAQRQILMLIEQMQYMLNSDVEVTPEVVTVLTRLRMLNETLAPKGSLGKPSGSVIDLERMFDSANRSSAYETSATIFNRYGTETIDAVSEEKEEKEEDMEYLDEIQKSITKKNFPVSLEYQISERLKENFFEGGGDYDSSSTFSRLNNQIGKYENTIQSLVLKKFRKWHNALKTILGFVSPDSIDFRFLESTINQIISEDELAKEIETVLRETFSKGFSLNNSFESYNDFADTDFTLLNSDIANWVQSNSFGSAKEISETMKKRLRNSLRDGYSKGESVSKLRRRILDEIGLSKEAMSKTKGYAELVAKTEVARVVNYAKKSQLEMSGNTHWKYIARLDNRNLNERPNKDGYTCRKLHDKVFPLSKTDVMPPLHPNCRCTVVGVTKKNMEDNVAKAIDTAAAEPMIPELIATDAEAAKPQPSEKGRAECVKRKIPIIKREHPEWKMDQVVAVAYHMCAEGHKKDFPVTSEIIGNELFEKFILQLENESSIAKTYLDTPKEEALLMAHGNMAHAKSVESANKWGAVIDYLENDGKSTSMETIPSWLRKLKNPNYAVAEAERYYEKLKGDKAKQKWEGIIRLLINRRDAINRRETTETDRDKEEKERTEFRRGKPPQVRKKPKQRRRVKPKVSKPRVKLPRPEDRGKLTKHQKKFLQNQTWAEDSISRRLRGSKDDNEEDNVVNIRGQPVYSERRKLKIFLNNAMMSEESEGRTMSPNTRKEILKDYDRTVDIFMNTREGYKKYASLSFPEDTHAANVLMEHYDRLAPRFDGKMEFRKIGWKSVTNWSRKGSKKREKIKGLKDQIKKLGKAELNSKLSKDQVLKLRYQKRNLIQTLFLELLDPKLQPYYRNYVNRLMKGVESETEKVGRREKPEDDKPAPKEENEEEMSDEPSEEELEDDADMKE